MKKLSTLILLSLLLGCNQNNISYPFSKIDNIVDNYHGTMVEDPYRWLETPMDSSIAVKQWVDKQNELTKIYLDAPYRNKIEKRLKELWTSESQSSPIKAGNKYFYYYNDGSSEQARVYMKTGLNGTPELLLSPDDWSDDGTISVIEIEPSPDGKYLAYATQESGSDWRTFRILDVTTGKELPEQIERIKYSSLRWMPNESGFFYSAFLKSNDPQSKSGYFNRRLYYHKLGTSQDTDELAFNGFDSKDWVAVCRVSRNGKYLIISYADTRNEDAPSKIVIKNLTTDELTTIKEYQTEIFGELYYMDSFDDELFFFTSNQASNNRIISINLNTTNDSYLKWKEVIPETENTISWAYFSGGKILVQYLVDVQSKVEVHEMNGNHIRTLKLPGIGIVSGINSSPNDSQLFFSFSSLNLPRSNYFYDVNSNISKLYFSPKIPFTPDDITVEQIFYKSIDGTKIPMFIMHKKDMKKSSKNPLLLHGYGGFNITQTPVFQTRWLSWVDMGGVFALANIRGGGEYGEDWHKMGLKGNKQNVFDDFIAGAEYLIKEKYTSKDKLAIAGESNGGLLVGAVVNQRPDLFAAALPDVGVMDMLRFHSFSGTASNSTYEYGQSTNPEEFDFLYKYSPYHNIKRDVKYPAVMATTASNDNNVLPGHTLKYIARLQKAQASNNPILLRMEMNAGHMKGRSKTQLVKQYTDKWVFLVKNLNIEID